MIFSVVLMTYCLVGSSYWLFVLDFFLMKESMSELCLISIPGAKILLGVKLTN